MDRSNLIPTLDWSKPLIFEGLAKPVVVHGRMGVSDYSANVSEYQKPLPIPGGGRTFAYCKPPRDLTNVLGVRGEHLYCVGLPDNYSITKYYTQDGLPLYTSTLPRIVEASSKGGKITGWKADTVIFDDPIDTSLWKNWSAEAAEPVQSVDLGYDKIPGWGSF